MIGCLEIQKAIAELLGRNGFFVVARENQEGAQRPMCGVDVFPATSQRVNDYMQEDSFAVEIEYYPASETHAELIRAADRLKPLLLYQPLEIDGRVLDTSLITFGREDMVLVTELEYTVMQACDEPGLYEDMPEVKELDFLLSQTPINPHGT